MRRSPNDAGRCLGSEPVRIPAGSVAPDGDPGVPAGAGVWCSSPTAVSRAAARRDECTGDTNHDQRRERAPSARGR